MFNTPERKKNRVAKLVGIVKARFNDGDVKKARDILDKLSYREMWGKKRSDDQETDSIYAELDSKETV